MTEKMLLENASRRAVYVKAAGTPDLKIPTLSYVYQGLAACICVHHECRILVEAGRGRASEALELESQMVVSHHGCWESNLGPLGESVLFHC